MLLSISANWCLTKNASKLIFRWSDTTWYIQPVWANQGGIWNIMDIVNFSFCFIKKKFFFSSLDLVLALKEVKGQFMDLQSYAHWISASKKPDCLLKIWGRDQQNMDFNPTQSPVAPSSCKVKFCQPFTASPHPPMMVQSCWFKKKTRRGSRPGQKSKNKKISPELGPLLLFGILNKKMQ